MESILKAHHLEKSDIEPEALQMCLSGLYDTEAMERVARISATNKYLNSHGYPGLPLFPAKKSIWECDSNSDNTSAQQSTTTTLETKNDGDSHDTKPKPKKKRKQKTKNSNDDDTQSFFVPVTAEGLNANTHLPPSVLSHMSEEDIQKGAKMGLNAEEYFMIKGNYGKLFDLELDQSSFYHMMKKCKTKVAIRLRSNKKESMKYLQAKLIGLARLKLKGFVKSDVAESSKVDKLAKEKEESVKNGGIGTEARVGDINMHQAADFIKVMMAMHPPLPRLSPSTTTAEKHI